MRGKIDLFAIDTLVNMLTSGGVAGGDAGGEGGLMVRYGVGVFGGMLKGIPSYGLLVGGGVFLQLAGVC